MYRRADIKATSRQLAVFEAVARLGSFTRAAEALHLTQPTISIQIKELTEAVGLPLLEQQGRKLKLTEAGEDYYILRVRCSMSGPILKRVPPNARV
jgi:DNA-binding transcriptional ArsR family regulator